MPPSRYPPPPLRKEWWKFAHERLQPSRIFLIPPMILFNDVFQNKLQGISIIYTNNELHNYGKCKTLDKFYCKERETLTDFLLLIRLGLSNSFLISAIDFFLAIFFNPFCNNKINILFNKNMIRAFYIPTVKICM